MGRPRLRRFPKRFFFHFHVSVDVYLGCFDGFMAEPKCDGRSIYSGLDQPHGCGVPEHMWRHSLFAE